MTDLLVTEVPDLRLRFAGETDAGLVLELIRELLRCLARIAVARGCGRLEWSVLDWNEPAIRFYERLGARTMGDWTVYRVSGEALADLAGKRGRPDRTA